MRLTPSYPSVVTIGARRVQVLAQLQARHPRASFDELDAMIAGLPTLADEQRSADKFAEMAFAQYLTRISQGELDDHRRNPYRTLDQVFDAATKGEADYKNAKPWTAPDSDYLAAAQKEVDEFIGWKPEPPDEPIATAADRIRIGEAYAEQARVLEGIARQPGMSPAKYEEIARSLGYIDAMNGQRSHSIP